MSTCLVRFTTTMADALALIRRHYFTSSIFYEVQHKNVNNTSKKCPKYSPSIQLWFQNGNDKTKAEQRMSDQLSAISQYRQINEIAKPIEFFLEHETTCKNIFFSYTLTLMVGIVSKCFKYVYESSVKMANDQELELGRRKRAAWRVLKSVKE